MEPNCTGGTICHKNKGYTHITRNHIAKALTMIDGKVSNAIRPRNLLPSGMGQYYFNYALQTSSRFLTSTTSTTTTSSTNTSNPLKTSTTNNLASPSSHNKNSISNPCVDNLNANIESPSSSTTTTPPTANSSSDLDPTQNP
ncbi:hypothetical protein CVS40_9426 [Lucilia cuprina]|nr:hypothetical protein CVS40_9426 [Lucilia cuprina]